MRLCAGGPVGSSAVAARTWNVASLLGTPASDTRSLRRHRRKIGYLKRYASRTQAFCLQELRGTPHDLGELRLLFLEHEVCATTTRSGSSGGTGFLVMRSFVAHFDLVEMIVLVLGRIAAFSPWAGDFCLHMVNVPHIETGGLTARQQVQIISAALPLLGIAIRMLVGDFNFVHLAEGRLNVITGEFQTDNSGVPELFRDFFGGFAELCATGYTRREYLGSCIHSLSRVNRIWVDWSTQHIRRYRFFVFHDALATDPTLPSDHVSVCLRIARLPERRSTTTPRIPRWISEHPVYSQVAAEYIERVATADFTDLRPLRLRFRPPLALIATTPIAPHLGLPTAGLRTGLPPPPLPSARLTNARLRILSAITPLLGIHSSTPQGTRAL